MTVNLRFDCKWIIMQMVKTGACERYKSTLRILIKTEVGKSSWLF